jgi:hypothetical protein
MCSVYIQEDKNNMNHATTTLVVLILATLVVGSAAFTTIKPQTAYAYKKKVHTDEDIIGNTITKQNCLLNGTQNDGSGNSFNQECRPVICTNPSENAICSQQEAAVVNSPNPSGASFTECTLPPGTGPLGAGGSRTVTCDVPKARVGDLAIAQYIGNTVGPLSPDLIVTATQITSNGSVDLLLKNISPTVSIPLDNQRFSIIVSRE